MCSDPLDPGGEVRGCSVGCTIAMPDTSTLVFITPINSRSISSFQEQYISSGCPLQAASMRPACFIYLSSSADCESCTRPISINPRSMEAGEHGLTRGACFVAHRLEVVAVTGLL